MTAPLHEIDLKTPTQPFPEPPPPYSDFAPPQHLQQSYPSPQQPYPPSHPIGFQPSSPQQPYPSVGFHAAPSPPPTDYHPPYPIGTGTYPGAGSYGHANCPPNNNAYIIRTPPVCATNQCHIDRMRRRRRILFILAIVISFCCLGIAFGVILGI